MWFLGSCLWSMWLYYYFLRFVYVLKLDKMFGEKIEVVNYLWV